jgi:cell division septum initiation protein DivIVA
MHGARDEAVPLPPPFEVVLRGFDRQQVIDHVNALNARIAAIGAERDAALQRAADVNAQAEKLHREASEATRQVSHLRREAAEAATEVDRLQRSPLTAATARIQRMLQMAEAEAADLAAGEHSRRGRSAADRDQAAVRASGG